MTKKPRKESDSLKPCEAHYGFLTILPGYQTIFFWKVLPDNPLGIFIETLLPVIKRIRKSAKYGGGGHEN
jgi:hypothetical protein